MTPEFISYGLVYFVCRPRYIIILSLLLCTLLRTIDLCVLYCFVIDHNSHYIREWNLCNVLPCAKHYQKCLRLPFAMNVCATHASF